MKIATVTEIKKELTTLSNEELIELNLTFIKYKKENKELVNYLLFEADHEQDYIEAVKSEATESWNTMNTSSLYYAKKTIRKTLRFIKKQIKFSGIKTTEIELLIFFCRQMKGLNIPVHTSKAMMNLYERQLQIINKSLNSIHEDLRIDYESEWNEIKTFHEKN